MCSRRLQRVIACRLDFQIDSVGAGGLLFKARDEIGTQVVQQRKRQGEAGLVMTFKIVKVKLYGPLKALADLLHNVAGDDVSGAPRQIVNLTFREFRRLGSDRPGTVPEFPERR